MAKRNKPAPSGLPSREQIVAFIAETPGKVGKREISQAFNIKGGDRIWLKADAEGSRDRRHRRPPRKKRSSRRAIAAGSPRRHQARDRDGELVAEPTEWDAEEHGPIPTIIISMPRKPRPGSPVPGVGDSALIRVNPLTSGDIHRYAGRVTKILEKQRAQVLGIFRSLPEGGGRLIPVEKKSREREIHIMPGDEGGAQDGDLVATSVVKHPASGFRTPR